MNVLPLSSLVNTRLSTVLFCGVAGLFFANPGSSRADYQSAVLAKSPVGYWRLNDAVAAPSNVLATNLGTLGAIGNGTFENDLLAGYPGALPAQGATNFAIHGEDYLEGNRVRVPFHPVFNTNGSFSVEFWCKPGQTNILTCPAASTEFADPATNIVVRRGWLFYQGTLAAGDGSGWLFRVYLPPGSGGQAGTPQQVNCAITNAVDTNKWYHIAGTFKATNPNKGLTLYVN